MKYKSIIASIAVLLLISGCEPTAGQIAADELRVTPRIMLVGTINNCEVSYIDRGYKEDSFYMAECPSKSVITTRNYTDQVGKVMTKKHSTLISQETEEMQIKKQREDAVKAAKEKLTKLELELLGLK